MNGLYHIRYVALSSEIERPGPIRLSEQEWSAARERCRRRKPITIAWLREKTIELELEGYGL